MWIDETYLTVKVKKLKMKAIQLTVPNHLEMVESVWRVDLDLRKAKLGYYRLPDNYSEIIIVLKGEIQRSVIGTRQSALLEERHAYLAPVRSKGTVLRANEDVTFILVKIAPQYQHVLLGRRQFETRNGLLQLETGEWSKNLLEGSIPNTKQVIQDLECFVQKKMDQYVKIDPVVEASIALIKHVRGDIRVKELNEELGVCKSTLEEKFNRNLGLSPKEFCKIEKINQFLDNYQLHKDEMTLTQLTFKSGYYDQSHLIKEFRYFVDVSPRKYLKEVNKLQLEATPPTARILEGLRPAGFVAQTA